MKNLSFIKYLKFKIWTIAAFILIAAIFIITLLLYGVPRQFLTYPIILSSVLAIVLLLVRYCKAREKCAELESLSSLSCELLERFPDVEEIGEEEYQNIIRHVCEETRQSNADHIARYNDMIDYYSMWAHQVKTPIASMRLNLQNQDSKLSRQLQQDLNRIERYVDMVMTYLKLDSRDSDLIIREHDLDEMVKPVLRKFSNDFISKGLSLKYDKLDCQMITDDKWLCFVLEQLMSNAVKYTRTGQIEIFIQDGELCIRDSGIGIAPEDLPRVFEKGYTGFNGRMDKRASGIGLYLCKRICDKLGHSIRLESKLGVGTTAIIDITTRKLNVE